MVCGAPGTRARRGGPRARFARHRVRRPPGVRTRRALRRVSQRAGGHVL